MENTRKDTVSAEMAGRGQSAMFQKNNALIQRALVMAPASWESASVCQDTKEKYARKVRAPFSSTALGFSPTELSKAPFYASNREISGLHNSSVLNISALYMEQGVEVRGAHVSPDSL